MAVGGNFRTAWNGFNRNDVVNYIEECSVNYERALRQLKNENAQLRAELEALKAAQDAAKPVEPAPEAAAPAEPAPAEAAEPAKALETAGPGDELEAYRRAEAVERSARLRAEKLGAQVGEIVGAAVEKFDAAGADVDALMSDLSICLRRLNDTLAELRLNYDSMSSALAAVNDEA